MLEFLRPIPDKERIKKDMESMQAFQVPFTYRAVRRAHADIIASKLDNEAAASQLKKDSEKGIIAHPCLMQLAEKAVLDAVTIDYEVYRPKSPSHVRVLPPPPPHVYDQDLEVG